jgi:hypothetical protein
MDCGQIIDDTHNTDSKIDSSTKREPADKQQNWKAPFISHFMWRRLKQVFVCEMRDYSLRCLARDVSL